jgi:divalent metal cation (Fe/Co/Zn/Cd) transporter
MMLPDDSARSRESTASYVKLLHRGLTVEYVSLGWMTIECLVAIYAGIAVWSLALLAFGGDSFIELLSSSAVIQHLRAIIERPQSAIGHTENKRVEWATALLLVSLLPVIGVAALYSFLNGLRPESSGLGIVIAAGAVVIMPILWYEKRRIGAATHCEPLTIDAAESATCFLMSLALLLGLAVNFVWKVPSIDYVATLVILLFVAREAAESIREIR